MMKHAVRVTLWVVMAALVAVPAMAQTPQWTDHGFVFGNFVYQIQANKTVTTSATSDVYGEKATVESAQVIKGQGPTFDVGAGIRLVSNLGLGVAYSQISTTANAGYKATVPHPLVYDQPRTASGAVEGLKHQEQQFHFFAMWMVPVTEKLNIAVYGGPTMFQLKQDVVSNVTYKEVGSPYTSVTVSSSTSTISKSQLGFNLGGDITVKLSKAFGIGGFARYSTAKVTITPTGAAPMDVTVGGFQTGGGLRIFF